MKNLTLSSLFATILFFNSTGSLFALELNSKISSTPSSQEKISPSPLEEDVAALQDEWARIKYKVVDQEMQLKAIHSLETKASYITAKYPENAEPKIWEGIILSTDAGIVNGLSSLGLVKTAKSLFEDALKINSNALNGSAFTSLGSLYYQVPGWPLGFGDDEKAEDYLKKALEINPEGIDPNYFYGDFLLKNDRGKEARIYLERALKAPDREGREVADTGRRQEIKAALSKINI